MTLLTFTDIQQAGQAQANAAPVVIDPAAYRAVPAGKTFAQQGDVYFRKLAAIPDGAIPVRPYSQLAPGHSLGSRHCLDSLDGLQMFCLARPGPLDGPILLLAQAHTVKHPEHGHITLPMGACVQVRYQRLFADALRRAAD